MNGSLPDKNNLSEQEFLKQYNPGDFERLSVSVDIVVFSIDSKIQTENYRKLDDQKLTVLLVKRNEHPYRGKWSLPGGFTNIEETLEEAAYRVLYDKTGLDQLYIEQLYTFSDPGRDPRMRVIGSAYISLIDRSGYRLTNTEKISDVAWFEIEFSKEENLLIMKSTEENIVIPVKRSEIRKGKIISAVYSIENNELLAFDHASLILEGLLRLRGKIEYTDIVFNMMPDQFTISQLQQVYEIILGRELLPAAFRRKIADKIVKTGEFTKEKGHRPSQLFTYNG